MRYKEDGEWKQKQQQASVLASRHVHVSNSVYLFMHMHVSSQQRMKAKLFLSPRGRRDVIYPELLSISSYCTVRRDLRLIGSLRLTPC